MRCPSRPSCSCSTPRPRAGRRTGTDTCRHRKGEGAQPTARALVVDAGLRFCSWGFCTEKERALYRLGPLSPPLKGEVTLLASRQTSRSLKCYLRNSEMAITH